MILDEKRVSIVIGHGKQGRMHYEKWWKRRRADVRWRFHWGMIPCCLLSPDSRFHWESANTIMPAPLSATRRRGRCAKTGLPVPAAAEAVLEGWIYPDKKTKEGPFGEWTGYYTGGQRANPAPILEVDTILHRKNPILLGAPPGKPPHDYSL